MVAFSKDDVKLGVIGCGKMASAILGGIYKHKFLRCDDIYVYDINMDAVGSPSSGSSVRYTARRG